MGAVYTDVLRGVPTILLVFLVGFGVPALELEGLPTGPVLLGGVALALSYSAYVAEVYRAGIDSVHPSQRSAALALGLTESQTLRHVVLPQAVRRVVPPLLNDFISLQKDVALVSVLGVIEAFRVAQIDASSNFNYTPLLAAAAALPVRDDPAGPRRRPDAAAMTPVLEVQGVTKAYGDVEVLRGIDLAVNEHQAVALIGASGSGKSTLLRCVDLLEEIDDGDVFLDGEVITDPSVDPTAVRRRLGMVFQSFNLFPHMSVLDNVALGPVRAQGVPRAQARERGRELLERFGLGGREDEQPGPPLRRPAAARGDRARAGHPAARAAARRGHQRARPGAGGRGARRHPRPQGRGHDDADRHPRDAVRARRGRRGVLPARGPRARARPGRSGCSARRSARRRSASCDGCWRRADRSAIP